MTATYHVVGHRGLPQQYPENSLAGLVAAATCGADAVELDMQVSRDGVPMVFHDESLQRVCGRSGNIWDYTAEELSHFTCHEPERFGDKFITQDNVFIATLAQACDVLKDFKCHVFIEIKEKSLEHISREHMLAAVLDACAPLANKFTLISFDYDIILLAKKYCTVGWALREYDRSHFERADRLKPDILICDVKKLIPEKALRQGEWRWFLYDIINPDEAVKWVSLGADFIETWDVRALISSR